ncbi:MAG: hypothetical protein HYZ54_02490, partial [Ignavibacteriae bacterium]|nr:hypothetical protein [Ignavibacteriota bacterium]
GQPTWTNAASIYTFNNGLTLTGTTAQLGGTLIQNTTVTGGAFDMNFQKSGTGNVNLTNNNNTANQLRFYEPSTSGTNYSAFQSGVQTGDITYTLPTAAPSLNGQILSSTTGGVMSWIGVGSFVKAGNGLQNAGADSVILGGALTQNTTINLNTKDLSLSTSGNTGNVIIGKFTTAGIVKNSALGVLSSGAVNLNSTEVTGTLGISNGGTNNTTAGAAGQVVYYDGTKYNYSTTGTSGQLLVSGGAGQPTWTNAASIYTFNNGLTLTGTTAQLGGTLIQNTTVTGGAFDMIFQKSGTGNVNLTNNNNTANQLRFYEPSTSGVNFTSFKAAAQSADISYVLPTTQAASSGDVLTNDGSGNLSWTDPSASGNFWSTSGNNINANAFIGPTNGNDFKVQTGPSTNLIRMVVLSNNGADNGNIGINPVTNASNQYTAPRDNLDVFGNIRISNQGYGTDGTLQGNTGELRFMEPSGGNEYTAFKAGLQASNITYTLPTSAPSVNNQILSSTTAGVMSWSSVGSLVKANNGLNMAGDTVQLGGALIENTTITGGAFDMIFQKSGTGNVTLTNSNNTANQLRFYEPSTSGSNYTAFQAAAQAADVTYTLPVGAPSSNGQVLSGTTAGVLSWANASGINKAGNGLTAVVDSVILGGALTQNTTINLGPKDLSLSASGNTGNVIIGKFTTAGIVKNGATGILTSGTVNLGLTSEVSGTLNVSNGGTGSTTVGPSGTVAWSDGTKYMFTSVGTTGQFLTSANTGQPTWTSPTSIYSFTNGLTLTGNVVTLGGSLTQNTTLTGAGFDVNFLKSAAGGTVNLTNNNNTANQLRFYEPSTSGSNYTAFQAGAQSADITYTLPTAAPAINGYILQSSTAGVMSWIDPATAANAWSLTGNSGTNAANNFLGTTDGQDLELRVQGSPLAANSRRLRLFTSGAIQRADGITLPTAPGAGSVDFQSTRTAGQVATGTNSTISGGGNNTASNSYATISGGQTNTASGTFSTIGGGQTNTVSNTNATISGGSGNTVNGAGGTIGGGVGNLINGTNSVIPGGNGLTIVGSSFGFSASTSSANASSIGSNIAYFGDADLIIGNIDNSARGLRFYEANSSGTFAGANYTSFKAGAQTSDINYTLPLSIPSAGNKGVLTTDNTGALTWQSFPTGGGQNVVTGVGVATRIAFWGTASELDSDADLYWDNTNDRLGVGLTTPQTRAHIDGGNATATYLKLTAGTTTGTSSTDGLDLGVDASGNAEIRQRENLPMLFYTNNNERMRILNSGEIGIGLTSPQTTIHQDEGNATATYHKFTAGTTTGQGSGDGFDIGITSSGNAELRQRENLYMAFFTNNNERMRILSGGNVGINSTSAPELLSVDNGNSYFRGITTAGTINYMELRNQNNTAYELRFFEPDGAGTNYNAFKSADQNQTITYTLPSDLPAVNEVLTATTVTGGGPYQVSLSWTNTGGGGNQDAVHGTGTATEVAFWADDSTITSDSRLYWDDANLRLGIGTNTPSQSLETQGHILISNGNTAAQELRFQEPNATSSTNEYTAFKAQSQSNNLTYTLPSAGPASSGNGSNRFAFSTDNTGNSATVAWNTFWSPQGNAGVSSGFLGTTDAQPLVIRTNNSERMRILSGGSVGIGTNNPGQLLETMNGNLLLNNNNNTAAQLRFAEPSTSGANFTAFRAVAQAADITYSLPVALPANNGFMQTTNAGILSWTAIPVGQTVLTGVGVATRVAFWSSASELSSNADLYWDNTNQRLGIGTATPSQSLEILDGNAYLNNSGTAAQLRFREPSASGSNFTAFQAVGQTADITYSLPSALPTNNGIMQSSNTGVLSWTAIPAGESVITGTGVATRVAFWNSATSLTSDANLYWDNTNDRLGIGTATPAQSLEVLNGNGIISNNNNTAGQLRFQEPSTSGANFSAFRAVAQANNFIYQLPAGGPKVNQPLIATGLALSGGDSVITLSWGNATSNDWALLGNTGTDSTTNFLGTTDNKPIIFKTNNGEEMRIVGNTGFVGIGTSTPTGKLTVSDASARTAAFTAGLISNTATSSTASINKTGMDIQSTGTWNGGSAKNIGLNVNVSGGTTNYSALFNGGNVGAGTTTPNTQVDIDGGLAVRPATQSIASNTSVTVGNRSYIRLTNTGGGSYTITLTNGVQDGQVLIVQFNGCTGAAKLIFSDSGNLSLSGDFSPSTTQSTISFVWDGSSWVETARSLN